MKRKPNSNQNNNNNRGNGNGLRRVRGGRVSRRRVVINQSNQSMPVTSNGAPLQALTSYSRPNVNKISRLGPDSDFLTSVVAKASTSIVTPADRILVKQPLSASSFPGTRITGLSSYWERYKWLSAVARYVPAVPNTVACQFVMYIDTDPLDDPSNISDDDQIVRQAVSQAGSNQFNFNTSKTVPLIVRADNQYYYTGVDKQNLRFSLQGILYIIQVTDLINFNGELITQDLTCGSLFLDWLVNFSIPQINPTSLTDVRVDKAVNFIKPEVSGVAEIQTVAGLSPSTSYLLTPAFLEQNFSSEPGTFILTATPVEGEGTISIIMDPTVTTVSGFIKVKTDTFGTFDLSVILTTASKKQTTGFNIIAATS